MSKIFNYKKFQILHQDNAIVVVYKPSGMLSVPYEGSHEKTAIDTLETIMRKNGTWKNSHKPYAVHRLDKETSGVMVFALSEPVKEKLMNNWHKDVTERIYIAVAETPKNKRDYIEKEGTIDLPLAQNAYHLSYVPKTHDPSIKTENARTHYKILKSNFDYSIFELQLDTGRKNQIRAHLSYMKYTLAGDKNYHSKTNPFGRLCLHAKSLAFIHPVNGKEVKFEVGAPVEWYKLLEEKTSSAKSTGQRKSAHKNSSKQNLEQMQKNFVSNKKLRGMDFIQRGQKSH